MHAVAKYLLALFFLCAAGSGLAQQTFTKTRISGAGPFNTNTNVTYRLQGSCNNLISGCGTLRIEDAFPAELVMANCPVSAFFNSITCIAGSNTLVLVRNTYAGGDSFSLDINLRVIPSVTVAVTDVINRAVAGVNGFICPPPPQNAVVGDPRPPLPPDTADCAYAESAPISINAPIPRYTVRKQRLDPATGLAVAAGEAVTYQVQICSTQANGNMPITNATLVDTLPNVPGLTAASVENSGGGVVAAGPPVTITWTLDDTTAAPTGLLNLHTGTGCANRSFVVRYPAGLPVGTAINNSANATIVPLVGAPAPIGPGTRNDTIGAPAPAGTSNKSAPDVAPGTGNPIVFSITANTNASNVRVPGFTVVERLPQALAPLPPGITFTSVSSGRWNSPLDGAVASDMRATIEFTTLPVLGAGNVCDFSALATLATDIASPGAAITYLVPGDIPLTATCLRWRFTDFGANGPATPRNFAFTTSPQVRFDVGASPPVLVPSAVENCTYADFAGGPASPPVQCANVRVELGTPSVQPAKSANPTIAAPGATIDFTLTANHVGGDSTAPIVNPILSDWLPIQLEFVSLVSTTPGGGVLQVTPDFGTPGRTLVRVAFTGSFAVGATGPRAVIRARVREGVPANTAPAAPYVNEMAVFLNPGPSGAFTCPNNSAPSVDANDLNNDGSTIDLMCPASTTFRVSEAFLLGGEKWVEGDPALAVVGEPGQPSVATNNSTCPDYDSSFGGPPSSFTRFPCVAQTDHGGNFRYRLRLVNAGNRLLEEYVVYDTIPFIGDTGVGQPLSGTARLSRWAPVLDGPLSATVVVPPLIQLVNPGLDPVAYASAAEVRIEYTTTPNFCRGQVRTANYTPAQAGTAAIENSFPAGCTPGVWTSGVPVPASLATGFRLRAFSTLTVPAASTPWVAGSYIEVDVPMRAPATGAPPSYVAGVAPAIRGNSAVFNPSWNSFAHRVYQEAPSLAADLLPTAEPPKVGVILPERYRIGNLVWRDDGAGNPTQRNNGRADTGEPGIDGVTVLLCRDTDGNAGPSAGDSLVASTVTATLAGQAGKYRFTDLTAGNDYYVAVANAPAQAALNGLFSTVPDEANANLDIDNNDNGASVAVSVCAGTANSIASGLVSLGPVAGTPPTAPEPTSETLRFGGGGDDDNDGATVFPDSASNFSVDFGFVQPVDLGDLPDTGAGVGSGNYETLIANNGPVHPVIDALRLGATVDTESDGQPNLSADGDDSNGAPDDEDGVTVADLTQFVGAPANVRVAYNNPNAGAASARLCGFIDYNGDGSFAAAETVSLDVAGGAATATLAFGTVPAGSTGTRHARFRISSDTGLACSAIGPASDGEVEDYLVDVQDAVDFGDLPDTAAGSGPGNYETLLANAGPSHVLRPGLRLGACEDAEIDGQPNAAADGDDLGAGTLTNGACAVASDDEDAVDPFALAFVTGAPVTVAVLVTNSVGVAANLCGFIDLNGDGDFADASEQATAAVPNGSNNLSFALNFGIAPPGTAAAGYARFRLSTAAGCAANGAAPDGEVEDYPFSAVTTDLGDLPDPGAGSGGGNYQTRLADGGALHPIIAGLLLGDLVDAEVDGQPDGSASGDDAQTSDDEDGVDTASLQFVVGQPGAVSVRATNLTAVDARICGFIDFDQDGGFLPGVEVAEAIVPAGSNNVAFLLPFTKPLSTPAGQTFARFRLSTDLAGSCVAAGAASDGEVEDYLVGLRRIDLGDLPDTGAGIGTGNYRTLIADNGPQHDIVAGLFMGASVDNEADGQASANADGDDVAGAPDDEDGVNPSDLIDIQIGPHPVRVSATNLTGAAARLCGFLDLNGDGDFADPGESDTQAVPNGSNNTQFTLNFGPVAPSSPLTAYARFRLSTAAAPCSPDGAEPDGEVEDYPLVFRANDLGDLPDTGAGSGVGNYNTLFGDAGASHGIVAGLRIGACVDDEDDGQANAGANGDDQGASGFTSGNCSVVGDDEDGVQLRPVYNQGNPSTTPVTVTNTGAVAATLCGFIDWNGDGDFADANESTQMAVAAGSNPATVVLDFGTVPANVPPVFGRFRLSTAPGCSASGHLVDGEVEDYQVNGDIGTMSLGNLVWEDLDNDGLVGAGEPGIPGIPVNLYLDSDGNGVPDGAALASQVTDASGNYLFATLLPDTYLVEVQPPSTFTVSTGTGRRWLPTGPFEPAPDPDNDTNDDDNGTLAGAGYWSLPVTLSAKGEPTDDGDADFNSNLSVDFGLLTNFDLALRKTLAPGQSTVLRAVGESADFVITVFNQGSITATAITITDSIPVQMQLNDPSWTALPGNQASIGIPGPLAPGESIDVPIRLRLITATTQGTINNSAEISDARDGGGNPVRDRDSDPDPDPANDGTPVDDVIDNQNQDEDDADFAPILIAVGIPALDWIGLLALAAVLLLVGSRRLGRAIG